jgi:Tfp pilus assembly protein PilF
MFIAFSLLSISSSVQAEDGNAHIWQKIIIPKPKMPQFLTKPVKIQAELPPREAAQACLTTAKELFDSGHDREAIQLFERARQLDPKQTQIARFLAVLYDRQHDTIHAEAEYAKALKLTPKDPDLLNDIGYFHYQYERWADAEIAFRDAIKHNHKHERSKVNLAMTLCQLGRYAEAFDLFREAVGPAAAHSNIGMMLAREHKRDEAIQAFQQALALQPELPQARAGLDYLTRTTQQTASR